MNAKRNLCAETVGNCWLCDCGNSWATEMEANACLCGRVKTPAETFYVYRRINEIVLYCLDCRRYRNTMSSGSFEGDTRSSGSFVGDKIKVEITCERCQKVLKTVYREYKDRRRD